VRLVNLSERNAGEDFESRGRRKRKGAMRALDRPAAIVQRGNEDLLHTKRLDTDASANDIRDGIECADLVESDILRRLAVNLSLGDRDPPKDRERVLFDERRELAVLDHLANLTMTAAMVQVRVGVRVNVGVMFFVFVLVVMMFPTIVLMLVLMARFVAVMVFTRILFRV